MIILSLEEGGDAAQGLMRVGACPLLKVIRVLWEDEMGNPICWGEGESDACRRRWWQFALGVLSGAIILCWRGSGCHPLGMRPFNGRAVRRLVLVCVWILGGREYGLLGREMEG